MKRFNWRKSFSAIDAFAVVDTHRGRRHVATCLTEESAEELATKLDGLRPEWRAVTSKTGLVTIIAQANTPGGQIASAAWSLDRHEGPDYHRDYIGLAITLVEDRLYAVVATEHARRR